MIFFPPPYASLAYARAFGAAYQPVYLEQQIFVLKRAIPGTAHFDAMGCYPLTPLSGGADMHLDFTALKAQGIVLLVLVTDPFFCPAIENLQAAFDMVIPYKEHYLHDFGKDRTYSKHHRDRVRRAVKSVEVRHIALQDYLEEWFGLYHALIEKRGITGIQAFSRDYFAALPDTVMFGGFSNGELVCAHLCFEHDGYVYSHLTASSAEGYRLRATYAVYDYTLNYFARRQAGVFDLGGGAGVSSASEGLAFFKQGFSNASTVC